MLIVIIIILILIIAGTMVKNKDFHSNVDLDNQKQTKLYRSIEDVDSKVKELENIIESHLQDVSLENRTLLEEIIEEWAEIQKRHTRDDRSWVRNTDKISE